MNNAGQFYNVFTDVEVDKCVQILKNASPTKVHGNLCHGVDEKNTKYYLWFQRKIFNRVQQIFGDDLILMFGMYLIENTPWKIHTDAYHATTRPGLVSAYSMLIPVSVDFDKNLVDQSQTIIFNEELNDNQALVNLPDLSDDPASAMNIFDECLSHNSESLVRKVTVNQQCQWQAGSLIYWKSQMLHDTKNFLADGYKSKQAIVIHTGYKKTLKEPA